MVRYRNGPKTTHSPLLQCGEAHVNSRALSQAQINTDQTNQPTFHKVSSKFHQPHSEESHNVHQKYCHYISVSHNPGRNYDCENGQNTQKSDVDTLIPYFYSCTKALSNKHCSHQQDAVQLTDNKNVFETLPYPFHLANPNPPTLIHSLKKRYGCGIAR